MPFARCTFGICLLLFSLTGCMGGVCPFATGTQCFSPGGGPGGGIGGSGASGALIGGITQAGQFGGRGMRPRYDAATQRAYLVSVGSGVEIVDASVPASPVHLGTASLPTAFDIVVDERHNVVYATGINSTLSGNVIHAIDGASDALLHNIPI